MSETPPDLHYTAEHEWVADPDGDGSVRVGITDFAQGELGDIVFVDLPEAGTELEAGSTCGELESTKSVSDVYAPVSGTVTAVNPALEATPELVNSDPYGAGWLFEVRLDDADAVGSLMDAAAYSASLES